MLTDRIYSRYFLHKNDVSCRLSCLEENMKKCFSSEEIAYLLKNVDKGTDLYSLEYFLRRKKPENIITFLLKRLIALAESTPENQNYFVNNKRIGVISVFVFMGNSALSFLNVLIKYLYLKGIVNEYPDL